MGRFTTMGVLLAFAWPFGCVKDDADEEFNGPAGDSPLEAPGSCEPACVDARDCCETQSVAMDCFDNLGSYPYNFACNAGVCEQLGCSSDGECTSFDPDHACIAIGDIGVCARPCDEDSDCDGTEVCDLGITEVGICRNACTDDSDCPDISHCESSRCVYDGCESDEDCAISDGGTCQDDRTCSCRTNAECSELHACAPA